MYFLYIKKYRILEKLDIDILNNKISNSIVKSNDTLKKKIYNSIYCKNSQIAKLYKPPLFIIRF